MKGYPTVFEEIIFIETEVPQMQAIAPVSADLSFKIGAQLKNLNDIKQVLAAQARMYGCNCVASFQYGQKSRWLAIDDVAFWGNGVAGTLSQEDYFGILSYIRQRDNA